MVKSRYEQAKEGVEAVFANPQDILDAGDFSQEQKIELLRQWEQDLRQLISASGEGMIARHPGRAAELLRQVGNALGQLNAA